MTPAPQRNTPVMMTGMNPCRCHRDCPSYTASRGEGDEEPHGGVGVASAFSSCSTPPDPLIYGTYRDTVPTFDNCGAGTTTARAQPHVRPEGTRRFVTISRRPSEREPGVKAIGEIAVQANTRVVQASKPGLPQVFIAATLEKLTSPPEPSLPNASAFPTTWDVTRDPQT